MSKDLSLSCADVEELLPLVAEALMDFESDPAVFNHLADCEHCSKSLALQDMITMSLGDDIEMTQAPRDHDKVIYFQIPKTVLSAAALFLVACTAYFMHSANGASSESLNIEAATAALQNLPETEILQVLPPQDGSGVPMILIRHQGQTKLIRQDQIDSGTTNAELNATIPVIVTSH
ncbi:MAG: hypothetical protein HRU15_09490 [Planctomycetes bacterium]|nr:hypothetical protein [Planctomycetota bacterium]